MVYGSIILLVLGGILYGAVMSLISHQILVRGWKELNPASFRTVDPETMKGINKIKRRVMLRYAAHFIFDLGSLFLIGWLSGSLPALFGAAGSMVIMQKILIVRYIKNDKKKEVKE